MNRKQKRRSNAKASSKLKSIRGLPNPGDLTDVNMLISHGDMLSAASEYPMAEQRFTRALELEPRNVLALGKLGFCLARQGKRDDAIESYQSALNLDPENAALMHDLGVLMISQRRFDEAKDLLLQVIARDPGLAEAHYNLAEVYAKLGQKDHAIKHWKESFLANKNKLALNRNNPRIRVKMGRTLLRMDMKIESLEWFREALSIDETNADAHYFLGQTLGSLKLYPEAQKHLQRAAVLRPRHVNSLKGLASAYMRQDKNRQAALCLQKVLKLDPESHECRHFLAALKKDLALDVSLKGYVTDLFDSYAENFDEHLVGTLQYRVPQVLNEAVRKTLAPTLRGGTIYDLGCGTGLCGPLFRDIADKLVGVDLSPRMLEKAEFRQVYDDLICEDIVAALEPESKAITGLIAADVLNYLGDLGALFTAAKKALAPDGWFIFTTEVSDETGIVLNSNGRYAHPLAYVQDQAKAHNFSILHQELTTGRYEAGEPVDVNVTILGLQS